MIRTASVTTSLSRQAGGLFDGVRRLHQTMAEQPGLEIRVLGLRDAATDLDYPAWSPLSVETFSKLGWRGFGYAPALRRRLLGLDLDLLHTHGLWDYGSIAVHAWHRRTRRPYLVSPHGMLDAWALRNSAWKKYLALLAYERTHLRAAACLRAVCSAEIDSIRRLGLKNRVCLIPNGIDLPPVPHAEPLGPGRARLRNVEPGNRLLLYLGRLHPKKGLMNLLRAWHALDRDEPKLLGTWQLALVGWDQEEHETALRRLVRELELGARVLLPGAKFGSDKADWLQACDGFILPSLSEGLPMAVLEAWAHGKPVLMTPACHLPEGFACHAALALPPTLGGIAQGLRDFVALSERERREMGERGRRLVIERFAWPAIAAQMSAVYRWLLGGGPAPDSVAEY